MSDGDAVDSESAAAADVEVADEVEGFDPASDHATSPNRGIVQTRYENLLARGKPAEAEELRRVPSIARQLQRAKNIRDFSPEHDEPRDADRVKVKKVYDALVEAGEEDAAAELAQVGGLQRQVELARDLDGEHFDKEVLLGVESQGGTGEGR